MLRIPIDFNGSSTHKVFPRLALNYLSKPCPGALSPLQIQMEGFKHWIMACVFLPSQSMWMLLYEKLTESVVNKKFIAE